MTASRSTKRRSLPSVSEAIGQAVMDSSAYKMASEAPSNLTLIAEFDVAGFPARYEASPSKHIWGFIDVVVVILPRDILKLDEKPGEVLPLHTKKGAQQGEVTASLTIPYRPWSPPVAALHYVSRKFQREWRNVR